MTVTTRREALYQWMAERAAHNGLTAQEIVDVAGAGLYAGHYRYARCFDDLKWMQEHGRVIRAGRPARWTLSKWAYLV